VSSWCAVDANVVSDGLREKTPTTYTWALGFVLKEQRRGSELLTETACCGGCKERWVTNSG